MPASPLALGGGRPVPQGLAMAAHQLGQALRVTALGGEPMDLGKGLSELQNIRGPEGLALAGRHQGFPQLGRIRQG